MSSFLRLCDQNCTVLCSFRLGFSLHPVFSLLGQGMTRRERFLWRLGFLISFSVFILILVFRFFVVSGCFSRVPFLVYDALHLFLLSLLRCFCLVITSVRYLLGSVPFLCAAALITLGCLTLFWCYSLILVRLRILGRHSFFFFYLVIWGWWGSPVRPMLLFNKDIYCTHCGFWTLNSFLMALREPWHALLLIPDMLVCSFQKLLIYWDCF